MRVAETSKYDSKFPILLGVVLLLCTTFILPNTNFDPISLPKFSALVLGSGVLFSVAFLGLNLTIKEWFFSDIYSRLIFFLWIVFAINLVLNSYALTERFIGVSGRNFGAITYACLGVVYFTSLKWRTEKVISQVLNFLLISSLIVSTYFVLQLYSKDPFVFQEYYGAPSSTLGNPNFVSSFAAMSVIAFWFPLLSKFSRPRTCLAVMGSILSIFVIAKTQSIQGIFILFGSLFVFIFVFLCRWRLRVGICFGVIFGIVAVVSFLGLIGVGKLGPNLAQETMLQRFGYWRAAIRMGLSSPLSGHGIESFGDFYREYRDLSAFSQRGGQVADSAHNLFLDLFAGGGFPLLLIVAALLIVPGLVSVKNLIGNNKINLNEVAILWIWSSFSIQSLISVNQIGISVWGWTSSGILAAGGLRKIKPESRREKTERSVTLNVAVLSLILTPIILCTSLIPLRNDAKFLSALRTQDPKTVFEATLNFPKDSKRLFYVASVFSTNGLPNLSKAIAEEGVKFNPRNFELLNLLDKNRLVLGPEKERIRQRIMLVEPRYQNNS